MSTSLESAVVEVCASVGNDPSRLVDVAREIQARFGCVSAEAIDGIHRDAGCLPADGPEPRLLLLLPLRGAEGESRHPVVRRPGRPPLRLRTRPEGLLRRARHPDRRDDGGRRVLSRADGLHRDERPRSGRPRERDARHRPLDRQGSGDRRGAEGAHVPRTPREEARRREQRPPSRPVDGEEPHPAGRPHRPHGAPSRGGHPEGRGHEPRRGDPRRQGGSPEGPRRCRLPDRHQVGDGAGRARPEEVPGLQCGRGRAGHLQGPGAPDGVSRTASSPG